MADRKMDAKALAKALRERRMPMDPEMGEKPDSELPAMDPEYQLPVYRGGGKPKPKIARR